MTVDIPIKTSPPHLPVDISKRLDNKPKLRTAILNINKIRYVTCISTVSIKRATQHYTQLCIYDIPAYMQEFCSGICSVC